MILPTARPNDISWYRCTALEAQSPPYFNTRGIAHNCHTTATTIYRLSGTQPALLRPGAVPVFCQSVRAAVQRPGWELLKAQDWGCQHWSSCSTHSCTQGTWKTAATMQHRLPDLNFLSGEKSRSSGKCLRRKFVSLQTGSQGR